MRLKTFSSLAAAATLILAAGSFTPVAANTALRVAQAGGPAMKPSSLQEKDARMTACSRYRRAFHQLDDVKRQIAQLQSDFASTDDIRPKLDALITQTNDAQQTARVRAEGCPGQHQ